MNKRPADNVRIRSQSPRTPVGPGRPGTGLRVYPRVGGLTKKFEPNPENFVRGEPTRPPRRSGREPFSIIELRQVDGSSGI